MIIGTAGHIDHGKTTLVKALTGVDCDRLREEKARGITLDLGYAYTPTLGFVDVPGHERLVHNMLAGATGMDFVLLVIAADDGPMPQTREHLAIAQLLGIRQAAVALTKGDRVSAHRLQAAHEQVRALLAPTPLAAAPVFEVVAPTGAGVDALREHLEGVAARQPARIAQGGFRLAIDRCFSLAGVGTVVTGTAFSGSVAVGDTLQIAPQGPRVRVRSLRAQDVPVQRAGEGERIALGLVGVEKTQIERGMWALAPVCHHPVNDFDGQVRLLPGLPPLKPHTPVHLHLGALDVPARVMWLGDAPTGLGQDGWMRIQTERDINPVAGDRFILRDASARFTWGGGVVLDIAPPRRGRTRPERLAQLAALADPDPAVALQQAARQSVTGVELVAVARNRNLDDDALAALVTRCGLQTVAGHAFTQAGWSQLGERLHTALAREHERSPELPGVERERLRRLTLPTLARAVFDALLAGQLAQGHIRQRHAWLHLPEHTVQTRAADEAAWLQIEPLLQVSPCQPPRVREVARALQWPEDEVRGVCQRMARAGALWPVAHDHYFTASAVAQLAAIVAQIARGMTPDPGAGEAVPQADPAAGAAVTADPADPSDAAIGAGGARGAVAAAHARGPATGPVMGAGAATGAVRAAALRDVIGGGRKVAIHILEFFDRIGYTRRVRDAHVLRGDPAQFAP